MGIRRGRRSPGGVPEDVIRACGNTALMNQECWLECAPDEAAVIGGMLAHAAGEWLDEFEAYQAHLTECDK